MNETKQSTKQVVDNHFGKNKCRFKSAELLKFEYSEELKGPYFFTPPYYLSKSSKFDFVSHMKNSQNCS